MDPVQERQPSYPFRRKTFQEFVVEVNGKCHAVPTEAPIHLLKCQLECVRIFAWSMIQRIQEDHQLEKCAQDINRDRVVLIGNMGYITSNKLKYDLRRARSNYVQLSDLLRQFDGTVRPYCWTHFLGLLGGNPLRHTELIARHFAILSDGQRLAFCKNLVLFPRTMKRSCHEVFFEVLDSVDVDGELEKTFTSNVKQMEKNTTRRQLITAPASLKLASPVLHKWINH